MSQSVKEFVRQSGVDVRSPDSNSNNNFARELEEDMFRRQDRMARREEIARGQQFFREPTRPELQQRRVPPPPPRRSRFAQFENDSPLENEFSDLNMNKLVNNALREPINTSEFDNMNLTPINEAAFEKGLAEMNPNTINEFGGLTDLEISPLKPGLFVGTTNKSITEKYFTIPINITESTLTIHTIRNGHHNLDTGERFVNTSFGTTLFCMRKSSFKLTINTLYLFCVYIKTLTDRCFTEWFFH